MKISGWESGWKGMSLEIESHIIFLIISKTHVEILDTRMLLSKKNLSKQGWAGLNHLRIQKRFGSKNLCIIFTWLSAILMIGSLNSRVVFKVNIPFDFSNFCEILLVYKIFWKNENDLIKLIRMIFSGLIRDLNLCSRWFGDFPYLTGVRKNKFRSRYAAE